MLGKGGIERLNNSFAVVVGLGAVGSYATEAMARSGIGKMRIIDFDSVCPTNINRQLYALGSTIGKAKCDVAKARILDINPQCQVQELNCYIDSGSMDFVFENSPDIIIDAIDSLAPKVELLAHAIRRNTPIVSSMGAALRTDPGQIRVDILKNTKNCPLACAVRKGLRKQGLEPLIPCVYSDELPRKSSILKKTDNDEICIDKAGQNRNVLGSLSTLTGIFGLTLANEALRILTNNFSYTD